MDLHQFILECGNVEDKHGVALERLYNEAFKSWLNDFSNDTPENPRVVASKKMGLTADDAFFIWAYTGSCSSWLNSDKRNCNEYSSDCKRYFAEFLERAIKKIPVHGGVVWRWEEADEKLQKFNWFKEQVGSSVRVPYFLSTSKDNITADPMLWEIITIQSGHARDISKISNNPFEDEVLFIANAKFKIISVKDDNRTVVMQELSPDTNVDFDLCRCYYEDPQSSA